MPIPEPRVGHISFTYKNYVGVWGGYHDRIGIDGILTNYSSPRDLWLYDTDLDCWILKVSDFLTDLDVSRGNTQQIEDNINGPFVNESQGFSNNQMHGVSGALSLIHKDSLYIFAGFSYTCRTNYLYVLNLLNFSWSKINTDICRWNPTPRDKLVGWEFEEKLYFFGGYGPCPQPNSNQRQLGTFIMDPNNQTNGWNNDLFIFNIKSNQWISPVTKGEVPSPRAAHACAQIGSVIYIFGGRTSEYRMPDLHTYDCLTNFWSGRLRQNGSRKPVGRSWHSLTAINETHLFLYGGFTTEGDILNDGWLLDVQLTLWIPVNLDFSGPRLWHSATLTQYGEVFIFGGSLVNILQNHQTRQSNEILIFRPSPKSLVRQCLNKFIQDKTLARKSLHFLPPQLARIVKNGMEGG